MYNILLGIFILHNEIYKAEISFESILRTTNLVLMGLKQILHQILNYSTPKIFVKYYYAFSLHIYLFVYRKNYLYFQSFNYSHIIAEKDREREKYWYTQYTKRNYSYLQRIISKSTKRELNNSNDVWFSEINIFRYKWPFCILDICQNAQWKRAIIPWIVHFYF